MQSLTLPIILLPHNTGLTLKAQLLDGDFENVGSVVTTGFSEIGDGRYLWAYASYPDGFSGGVNIIDDADESVIAYADITPADFLTNEQIAALVNLGSAEIVIASPVQNAGYVEIVQGDSYFNGDGRALSFSLTNCPDLTAADVVFTARQKTNTANAISVEGDVVTATGDTKVVRFELSSDDTEDAKVGNESYIFDIQATLANEHIVTLARGRMTVLSQMTIPATP
jgi:hypothetical protein